MLNSVAKGLCGLRAVVARGFTPVRLRSSRKSAGSAYLKERWGGCATQRG